MTTTQGGPKFRIDFEGAICDWDHDTITMAELREFLCLPEGVPLDEIDLLENSRRQLADDEVVRLRPEMLITHPLGLCPIAVFPFDSIPQGALPYGEA